MCYGNDGDILASLINCLMKSMMEVSNVVGGGIDALGSVGWDAGGLTFRGVVDILEVAGGATVIGVGTLGSSGVDDTGMDFSFAATRRDLLATLRSVAVVVNGIVVAFGWVLVQISGVAVGMWKLCGNHFTVSQIRVDDVDGVHML